MKSLTEGIIIGVGIGLGMTMIAVLQQVVFLLAMMFGAV